MSSLEGPVWGITAWGQSVVNELSSRVKERCKVKGRQVIGGHSVVFHCGPVKVIIPLAAEFPVRSIQDMGDTQLPQPELVVRHEPDTRVICMCNTSPAHNTWVWKAHMMLTCHPNTGAATPHRSGDRSVELNVKPPPAPGLLGSFSSCLIPLLHTDHIFSPLLGLCRWHFASHLVDHSSPRWHNLKLVFCQSFRR